MENIDHYLSQGVERVILGTSALTDRELLQNAVNKYGKRIAVGIDAKDGKVCVEGWEQSSNTDYLDFAKDLEKWVFKLLFLLISLKTAPCRDPIWRC